MPLIQLCHRAGDLICAHYNAPGAAKFESKGDDSPITRADLASHAVLNDGLLKLQPGIPVLSEESPASEVADRLTWRRLWLVDPLDGTKEFLDRTGEFTINVALVEDHVAVLGLLYLPLKRIAYVGIPGVQARRYQFLDNDNDNGKWQERRLATRALEPGSPLVLLTSRRHRGRRLEQCIDQLRGEWGPVERVGCGSALKFCQLVEGRGDFYPRFAPCCEWDTAAGQAVLEAAGGALVGLDGMPLRYNCRDTLLNPDFYGLAQPAHPLWQQLTGAFGAGVEI